MDEVESLVLPRRPDEHLARHSGCQGVVLREERRGPPWPPAPRSGRCFAMSATSRIPTADDSTVPRSVTASIHSDQARPLTVALTQKPLGLQSPLGSSINAVVNPTGGAGLQCGPLLEEVLAQAGRVNPQF